MTEPRRPDDARLSTADLAAASDRAVERDVTREVHQSYANVVADATREAADGSWNAFRADTEWVKARTESEKNGKLTTNVQSVFLKPTDFSPLQ